MMGIGVDVGSCKFLIHHLNSRSPPQSVVCRMKENGDGFGNDDILVVVDCVTNEIVLEVGTGDYDDWYPYCHFEYHPESMAINNMEIPDTSINSILGY